MAKKQHPADIAAEAQMIDAIRSADRFMASIFRGAGEYTKLERPTVLQAIGAGNDLVTTLRINAQPIIYAIGSDGKATMLTRALIERLVKMGTK